MTKIATLEGMELNGSTLEDLWDWASSNAKAAGGSTVSDATTYAKAKASALVLATLTGAQPTVASNPDGSYTISYQASQKDAVVTSLNNIMSAWKNSKATAAEPKIKYDLSNVIAPVIMRQAIPYMALAAICGGVGYALYKGTKRRTA